MKSSQALLQFLKLIMPHQDANGGGRDECDKRMNKWEATHKQLPVLKLTSDNVAYFLVGRDWPALNNAAPTITICCNDK